MTASATPSGRSDESGDTEQVDRDESAESSGATSGEGDGEGRGDARMVLDRSDESQDFVDQSVIDFDPDDGLYSGTAVTGDTDIPGAHVGEDGKVHDDDSAEAAAAHGETDGSGATEQTRTDDADGKDDATDSDG